MGFSGKRRAHREVSVAGHCMQAGADALERAKEFGVGEEGWRTASAMCAIAMWEFALEADVNYLLDRLIQVRGDVRGSGDPTLEDAYWLGLRERIDLFHKWAGADIPDFGRRPFQVVCTLKSIRDAIVHGRPHHATEEVLVENGESLHLPRSLQADWEAECTVDRAERHRDDVLRVHHLMLEAAGGGLGSPIDMLSVLTWT